MRGDLHFYINTQLPSASELIEQVGMRPDESRSKGDRIPSRNPKRKSRYRGTLVGFESPLNGNPDASIVAKLHALLDRLDPVRERLLVLKDQTESKGVDISYRIHFFERPPFATVAWLELRPADLRRIASFDATFECEYIWDSDSADPGADWWEEDPDRGFFYKDHWRSIHGLEPSNDGIGGEQVEIADS